MSESVEIKIGSVEDARTLFTYPNKEGSSQTLEKTIEHWFNQTLQRDFLAEAIECKAVIVDPDLLPQVHLVLKGTTAKASAAIETYAETLPKFFAAGMNAQKAIQKIKDDGKWDPRDKNWRFFMPLGLSMANNKALHFFHYPPQKMLELQNYLDDPVPHRVEDMMMACGVPDRKHAQAFECIVDGAPIAAPDDAGTMGTIPIEYFHDYQKEMVHALLKEDPKAKGFTIPIVVFGRHPRETFAELFMQGKKLDVNDVHVIEILDGLKTPVIGSNHPYAYYYVSQAKDTDDKYRFIGNGRIDMKNCKDAAALMKADLITSDWTVRMAKDPSQDPKDVMQQVKEYWDSPAAANTLCVMTRSHATMFYTDGDKQVDFTFVLSREAAAVVCEEYKNEICNCCIS